MHRPSSPSLWRDPNFLKLWAGQAISEIGSRVSREGLPLTAVMVLGAGPAAMGLMASLSGIAAFLGGPAAGIAADRWPKKPILILCDIGRALLLALVPLAAWRGWLSIPVLFFLVFLVGVLTVFFDVAYQSLLPSLVRRDQLLEANSRLALTASIAEVSGPAITGTLVQTLTAPRAILLDSISFLVSAASILWMRLEGAPVGSKNDGTPWRDVVDGLRYVYHHPLLRPLALRAATISFFFGFFASLYVLFAIRDLGMSPMLLGIIIAIGGASSLTGALVAPRAIRYLTLGQILIGSTLITGFGLFALSFAKGRVLGVAMMALQQVTDAAFPLYNIHELTLRQERSAPEMLGRVNACMNMLFKGVLPCGALLGGLVAARIPIPTVLAIAGVGVLASTLWLVFSPIRSLR